MSSLDAARQQWEEGNRRLESSSDDPELYRGLVQQLEVAMDEIRKRVGERFTLQQLADVYGGADRWMQEAVEERIETPGWIRHRSVVQDAAFHNYARGATDYKP
jgi:hypothetical protein